MVRQIQPAVSSLSEVSSVVLSKMHITLGSSYELTMLSSIELTGRGVEIRSQAYIHTRNEL